MVITMLLLSIIFLGSAMAMSALGKVTETGVNDISYRKSVNKFADDMRNGISSLLSVEDNSYSGITDAGLVINSVDEMHETTLSNGNVERVYKTTDITMYMIGSCQRRDVYITNDVIQENKNFSYYGKLNMTDKKLNKDSFSDGNIVWEDFADYTPIKVATKQFTNGDVLKTEFTIKTVNDMLSSIKITILIPNTRGYNREFNMVFTCVQEVRVSVK